MIITSPEYYMIGNVPTMFLAGGITDCHDWQTEMVDMLANVDIVLFNPRRADFPIGDQNAAIDQITWEYKHLQRADMILFWFPCETLCPIVLYELGWAHNIKRKIYIGTHPDYKRAHDVEIQMHLARPEIVIVHTLEDLASQVLDDWMKK